MDFEKLKEDFCDNYCKWPSWFMAYFKDPDDAHEVMLADCCIDCPLNELEDRYAEKLQNR